MEVWVSNQVGAAFRSAGIGYEVWFGEGPAEGVLYSKRQLSELLAGANDVTRHQAPSTQGARQLAQSAWRKDRSLRLLLMLLDPAEPSEEIPEIAECLERQLTHADVWRHCMQELARCELPSSSRLDQCLGALESYPLLNAALSELAALQGPISEVSHALARLPEEVFEGERSAYVEAAIAEGAFYEFAKAWRDGQDRQFAALKIGGRLRGSTPNAQQITMAWAGAGAGENRRARAPVRSEDVDSFHEETTFDLDNRSGREKYQNVLAQQRKIAELLRYGEINAARQFMDQLVLQQEADGEEFAAKSLCKMAQAAKQVGLANLHLEWSEWAVKLRPEDSWAQGQLADALAHFGRFEEARAALAYAQGEYPAFVATNLARIKRLTGDLEGALADYNDARERFPVGDDAHYAWTGIAEVYRDLGNLDEALSVYDEAAERFPGNAAVLSGRAAVQSEMGDFFAALQTLNRSLASNHGDVVALNGIARVYRAKGDLVAALSQYNDILSRLPDEPHSLSGRAEVYRLNREYELALSDFDRLIDLYPHMEVGYVGKGRVLIDRGEYESAQTFYASAMERFPTNQRILYSMGILEARRGNWNQSLALFDRVDRESPRNLRAKLGKIRVLNRMQQHDRAVVAADELLSLAPGHRQALNEKAAALFAVGRFQEAHDLSFASNLRSEAEWGAAFIRAMSLDAMGKSAEAELILKRGMSSPIGRVRRYITSGLAVLRLKSNNLNSARKIIQSAPGEASAVVHLHISAQSRLPSALEEYRSGASSDTALYAEVKEQIARRFKLIDGSGTFNGTRESIFEAEVRLLILDAANDDYMLQAAA